MCYAIPAKVVEIKKNIAVLDYFGERRNVVLDLPDIHIDDYVFAQGGILVRKVDEKEALAVLDTWKDLFFELKEIDQQLARPLQSEKLSGNALAVLQKVNLKQALTKEDLLVLSALTDQKELSVLYEVANQVRQREHSNASCVHGIIEFSNYCRGDCFYCGIRRERAIERYRMTEAEILAVTKQAIDEYGFKAIVLQSGEDLYYDEDQLERLVKALRQLGILIFLSIGVRPVATYKKLYAAGARAALMRFETSNPAIFQQLRPNTTLDERLALIRELKKIGYVLATGFLIGLPNEQPEDLVNNILLTKELEPEMYSFGPLIPTQDTPLVHAPTTSVDQVLKTIAIARLASPDANILVTTALETLSPEGKRQALLAGANSMMINLTPMQYRPLYSIYDNRACNQQEVASNIQATVQLLRDLGRAPMDVGF